MANCSDVYGTMTLEGEWTLQMLADLNTVAKEWASWSYNIVVTDDFTHDCLSQSFLGCGRWAFNLNLDYLDAWTKGEYPEKPSLRTAYEQLTNEMQLLGGYIDFTYSEEESGNQILRDGVARLRAENGGLLIDSLSEQNYEYCWKDFIERDFCGESMLEDLVAEIFQLLNVEDGRQETFGEAVEQWVMENTAPNERAEYLDEDQLSELRAIIGE